MIIVLSALITGFEIWKGLVISSTTNNKRPVESKEMIKPTDTDGLPDAEGLADAKELVVIYYKQEW